MLLRLDLCLVSFSIYFVVLQRIRTFSPSVSLDTGTLNLQYVSCYVHVTLGTCFLIATLPPVMSFTEGWTNPRATSTSWRTTDPLEMMRDVVPLSFSGLPPPLLTPFLPFPTAAAANVIVTREKPLGEEECSRSLLFSLLHEATMSLMRKGLILIYLASGHYFY